jgi:DNA (cytosine-5)-methyltransferase 1
MYTFYEFFAGGGMVRAGLGEKWHCLFANDFDHKKAIAYKKNWGDKELKVVDVAKLNTNDLPGRADLIWASFPCQDLSLAGGGAGLKGERSGTFRPFWSLTQDLISEGRSPRIVVLENVCGALTSHNGQDFATLCGSLANADYNVGAVVIDANRFVPQSRPRLFIVGVRSDVDIPSDFVANTPDGAWSPPALIRASEGLPRATKSRWIWWRLAIPRPRNKTLTDMIDLSTSSPPWFSTDETRRLMEMMTPLNRAKVSKAMKIGYPIIGSIYKRTRPSADGSKLQRAEVRFDDISGCLRTPAGGSSRQVIIVVEGDRVRARLISARETARLMGLSDKYELPENYNEAYHLTGDGVVVPVVSHLTTHMFQPILQFSEKQIEAAA